MDSVKDIITKIKQKNNDIDNTFDKILELNLNLNSDNVKLLYDIYNNLDTTLNNVEELYLLLSNNDPTINLDNNTRDRINDIDINNKIMKMFMPYMLLARMQYS